MRERARSSTHQLIRTPLVCLSLTLPYRSPTTPPTQYSTTCSCTPYVQHEINYNEFLAATMHRNTFIKEEYIRLAYNKLGESRPQPHPHGDHGGHGDGQSLSLRDSLPPCFSFV